MSGVNPALIDMAKWSISKKTQALMKSAFVPPGGGGDPAAGGMPPPGGDPNAMPPMDPAAAGGAPPPMDPSGAGGMMPPPDASLAPPTPPMTPDVIAQAVAQGMQQAGGGKGVAGKGPKATPEMMAADIWQTKRLMLHLFSSLGLSIPPDVMDDPNRDPATGAPGMGPGPASGPVPGPVPMQPGAAGQAQPPGGAPPAPAEKTGSQRLEALGTPTAALQTHDVGTQASAVALVARRLAKQRKV